MDEKIEHRSSAYRPFSPVASTVVSHKFIANPPSLQAARDCRYFNIEFDRVARQDLHK